MNKEKKTSPARSRTSGKVVIGRLYITPGAMQALAPGDIIEALGRHIHCDWGDACEEDWQANDEALLNAARLFSIYHSQEGTKFWVITEANRSMTTILLPDEY